MVPYGLVLALGVVLAAPLQAQIPTGKGPARLIVGSPAGEATDVMARLLARELEAELDTRVVVQNRSGAGGRIAAEYARHAAPDGLTVLVADTRTMVMAPLTFRKIRFDPLEDFVAIGRAASIHGVIALPRSSYASDVAQWLDGARGDETKATYGVLFAGSLAQFIGYRLGSDHGTDLLPVPYRDNDMLLHDLVGGHIAAGIVAAPQAAPYYRAGKLKVLAVNGSRRAALLPGVPTLKELGLAQFDSLEWIGLFAPKGTPGSVIEQWNRVLGRVLALGHIEELLLKIGMRVDPGTPQALQEQLAGDLAEWGPVIEASGFNVD